MIRPAIKTFVFWLGARGLMSPAAIHRWVNRLGLRHV
jgi:hypothetical protein